MVSHCLTVRCLSLTPQGSSKDLRPPSYTDRVLCHSLPGQGRDLTITKYELCEAMSGSDHRPVAALIDLHVGEGVTSLDSSGGGLCEPGLHICKVRGPGGGGHILPIIDAYQMIRCCIQDPARRVISPGTPRPESCPVCTLHVPLV
jgi:hypothetical protein